MYRAGGHIKGMILCPDVRLWVSLTEGRQVEESVVTVTLIRALQRMKLPVTSGGGWGPRRSSPGLYIRPGFLIVRSDRASGYQNQRWTFGKFTACTAPFAVPAGAIHVGPISIDLRNPSSSLGAHYSFFHPWDFIFYRSFSLFLQCGQFLQTE